jgi:hypothetical protein
MQHSKVIAPKSSLDGLWVLLVNEQAEDEQPETPAPERDGRVPIMARAGNEQTYLLGFKNMSNARKFIEISALERAEPRMVVKGNKDELLEIAQENGAVGVLVDYDPATQKYSSAASLF